MREAPLIPSLHVDVDNSPWLEAGLNKSGSMQPRLVSHQIIFDNTTT